MYAEQKALWKAIHEYAIACGGDPAGPPSEARMVAVASVELVIMKIAASRRYEYLRKMADRVSNG
jgi:hypothetical protein